MITTLDEAIQHCEEKAKAIWQANEEMPSDCKLSKDLCECAKEHEQLAKWLKELNALKGASKGDLISREALKEDLRENHFFGVFTEEIFAIIDNAPTVEAFTKEDMAGAYNEGYACGGRENERPQGSCENCDFRKFAEKFVDGFVDGFVDLMNKNGISSVEQLSEILKGGTNG